MLVRELALGDSKGEGILGVGCLLKLGRRAGATLRARCSESVEKERVLRIGLRLYGITILQAWLSIMVA